jgi:hypothetical protein
MKHDVEAPLWIERTKGDGYAFGRVSYDSMNHWHFKRYCERAKIYRPKIVKIRKKLADGSVQVTERTINGVSLHYLRHSKVTLVAKNRKVQIGIKKANEMFGWTGNSPMFLRYSHLTGQDSDDGFLSVAGVEEVNVPEKPSPLLSRKCLNCGEQNSAGTLYCGFCGCVLDETQARMKVAEQEMRDYFMKRFMEETRKDKSKS